MNICRASGVTAPLRELVVRTHRPAVRARQAVERKPPIGETLQPVGPVTISIGVALFPDRGRDFTDLIDVADRAMYAWKEAGRKRVTLAGHDLAELAAA